MKTKKVEAAPDFRVWCERCCIRIAPSEQRTVVGGKAYHPACYSKLAAKPVTAGSDLRKS
jgi:hypothetical protein